LLFSSTNLKHGRHFDYWNQHLNMHMPICYLDCHEAGLCCYLVIHTENLWHPLQLFCFHLWPVYWFSLIYYKVLSLTCSNNATCYVQMTFLNLDVPSSIYSGGGEMPSWLHIK
jgi:hypothetical protein